MHSTGSTATDNLSLSITTVSLPNGQAGTAYSATLVATGGNGPYSWSLTGGTLPTGLTLTAPMGTISGIPTIAVNSTPLTFTVTDSSKPTLTKSANLTLTISPATLTITTSSLPSGQVGATYATTLTATGGTSPYMWSVTSGNLPTGLSLNGSTGVVSGTPTASASQTAITFKVTDSSQPGAQPIRQSCYHDCACNAYNLDNVASQWPNRTSVCRYTCRCRRHAALYMVAD